MNQFQQPPFSQPVMKKLANQLGASYRMNPFGGTFHFFNGWKLSVQWGPGTRSNGVSNAEVAAFKPNGECFRIGANDALGWMPHEAVAELALKLTKMEPAVAEPTTTNKKVTKMKKIKEALIGVLCLIDQRIDVYGFMDDSHIPEADRSFYKAVNYALIIAVVFVYLCTIVLSYGLGAST